MDLKVAVSVLVLFLRIKTELTLYSITYDAVYPVETVFWEKQFCFCTYLFFL